MERESKGAVNWASSSGEARAVNAPPARLPFLSDDWLAMVEAVLRAKLASSEGGNCQINYIINERFPGAPASVAPDGIAAYSIAIESGRVSVRRGPRPDPDREIDTEWEAALNAVLIADDTEYRRDLADRIERGVTVVRGRAAGNPALQGLHHAISIRTAAPDRV
jgi:hypothetical protein